MVLDESRVDSIVELLEEKRLKPGWKTDRIHRANAKRREEAKQAARKTRPATEMPGDRQRCPRLRLRDGGANQQIQGEQFLGCPLYPKYKCRGHYIPLPQSG